MTGYGDGVLSDVRIAAMSPAERRGLIQRLQRDTARIPRLRGKVVAMASSTRPSVAASCATGSNAGTDSYDRAAACEMSRRAVAHGRHAATETTTAESN
jgi:hypothetical protein